MKATLAVVGLVDEIERLLAEMDRDLEARNAGVGTLNADYDARAGTVCEGLG
jgi:hypothetical protein